jgi:hypothetical protein
MLQQLSSTEIVLQLTVVFLTVGLLVSNVEYLFNYSLFTENGILGWNIIETHWKDGYLKKMIAFLFKQKIINILFATRVLLLLSLFFIPQMSVMSWSIVLVITLSYVITNLFTFYGSDGSDQMSNLILITICLCSVPFTSKDMLTVGFVFIAAQSCLSYFVAGVSKMFSEAWRNGSAVKEIFRTRTYGSKEVYFYIKDKKWLNIFLCWSVFVIEMLFPLVLFLPLEYGIFFLIWGLTFHLLNSFIMGLNTFFWAFLASYPSIIFVNLYIFHNASWTI